MPHISIIMPTCNHGKYLSKAIESVLAQSYQDWELLVVDDCYSADTERRVNELVKKDVSNHRIVYIKQENKGSSRLSETYNNALVKSKGRLIAILEGDDMWPHDKLEKQVSDFSDNNIVLSYGNYASITGEGRIIKKYNLNKSYSLRELNNKPAGTMATLMAQNAKATVTFPCTVVLKRSALEEIGGFIGCGGPVDLIDFPTFLELSVIGEFRFHDEILGYWRRHETQLTSMHHQDINENVYNYAVEFSDRHPELINKFTLLKAWRERFRWVKFCKARNFAYKKDWINARAEYFSSALLGSKSSVLFFASILGYLLSFLHINLDWLIRRMNKWRNQ